MKKKKFFFNTYYFTFLHLAIELYQAKLFTDT